MELLIPTAGPLQAPLPPLLSHFPATDAVSLGRAGCLSRRVSRRTLSLAHVSLQTPCPSSSSRSAAASAGATAVGPSASPRSRWVVVMQKPPARIGSSRADVIDYYVETLARVLGDEKEAQMCMYDASWQVQFRFCCDIDEEASRELAGLPGVLSVKPDTDVEHIKNNSYSNSFLSYLSMSEGRTPQFFSSGGNSNFWLVRMRKPGVEVVTKAQIVDYYAETLTKVLGNEKDAQACIYHIAWEKDFGFCCQIDEECAQELADVPEVIHVRPDTNFDSKNKEYRGGVIPQKTGLPESPDEDQIPKIKTKRLFVTGLSFYTSEKTLRAAFEGFGELVEVKVIMDKISKRSKGYAFIEYTTEESASAALKEMNGKIINGWMIVVDVAKTNPPRYNRDRQRPSDSVGSPF
ncbi:hypothetical protein Taro_033920 [Colocasia esculenta]|uniref:RRM domain-containing protein n=1 Tax=Colocasia esculenta TaxID=4460 RepID=A0A843VPY8_COLES|nr:hypothetical protein [Colocasia esculenta]